MLLQPQKYEYYICNLKSAIQEQGTFDMRDQIFCVKTAYSLSENSQCAIKSF